MNLGDINPGWVPPENRPNAMAEWGGLTPQFVLHDMTTCPNIAYVRAQLTLVSRLIKERCQDAHTKLVIDYSVPDQEYTIALLVQLPGEEPYSLTASIPDVVALTVQRDALVAWVSEYLQQLNSWLQQEGLQLPGEELLLLPEVDNVEDI